MKVSIYIIDIFLYFASMELKRLLNGTSNLYQKLAHAKREKIKGFKAKMDQRRSFSDKIADYLTRAFGTVLFLGLNTLWFFLWILVNTGSIPFIPIFDPFPFGLLTMIVSLEAIILAIIVLISQNRSAYVADIREEVDLQINVRAEEEITKILIILDKIHDHLGLPPEDDAELILMKQKTDLRSIEEALTNELIDN